MSQWSEKIPKENLSKTVSSTRYLFTSFSKAWVQINNFRKSSKKFIIDLLTKNVALNLSGAIFFVGLGYSLRWWYKDQLFVVLLKQNLPALSESQQNISWETGECESTLNTSLDEYTFFEYQTGMPHIDRIDLYANHICVKFKQPWQKHVYERFIGVFGEPAQANVSKQVLTTKALQSKLPEEGQGEALPFYLSPLKTFVQNLNINTQTSKETESKKIEEINKKFIRRKNSNNLSSSTFSKPLLTPSGSTCETKKGYSKKMEYDSRNSDEGAVDVVISKAYIRPRSNVNKFLIYTPYTPKKPIFSKKWFKLSPRNLCFLNTCSGCEAEHPKKSQKIILSTLSTKQKSPLFLSSKFSNIPSEYFDWGSWRSKIAEQDIPKKSTDKFSYPLQLTKKVTGWEPSPNLLVLNSYLDEIPYKLENVLQSYFPKKDSQLLSLSISFRESINPRFSPCTINDTQKTLDLFKETTHFLPTDVKFINDLNGRNFLVPNISLLAQRGRGSHALKQSETYLKKLHFFETKRLLQNQFALLINSFPIDFVEKSEAIVKKDKHSHTGYLVGEEVINNYYQNVTKKILEVKKTTQKGVILPSASQTHYLGRQSKEGVRLAGGYWGTKIDRLRHLFAYSTVANATDAEGLDPLLLLNTLGFTFNNFSPLTNPPILLSYDKLGVVSNPSLGAEQSVLTSSKAKAKRSFVKLRSNNGVTNLFKPEKNSNNATSVSFAPKDFLSKEEEIKEPLLPFLQIEDLRAQLRSISFYFHPKNLNWVVFQRSTNEKFNLLVKKIASKINKEDIPKGYSLITSNQPIPTPFINLMFEFLKGKTSLSYVYPFGFTKDLLDFDAKLYKEEEDFLEKEIFEIVTENSLLRQHKDCFEEGMKPFIAEEMPKAKRLIDLIKTNTVINKVDIQQKETKLETSNEINVVDKYVNFDKNSRFMSGYVYPDTQSNSLKAFLYQWLGKNKNLIPWFSSHYHYLNEKPFVTFNNQLTNIVDKASLSGKKISLDKIKRTTLATATPTIFDSLRTAETSPVFDDVKVPLVNSLDPLAKRGLPGEAKPLVTNLTNLRFAPVEGYAKCEYNVDPRSFNYGISTDSSLLCASTEKNPLPLQGMECAKRVVNNIGITRAQPLELDKKEKNGLSNQFIEDNHSMGNIEVPYKKFNHYLAQFPGFSDPNQFFTTLPQISCGNENLVLNNDYLLLEEQHVLRQEESQEKSIGQQISEISKDDNLVSQADKKTWGTRILAQRGRGEDLLNIPSKAKEYDKFDRFPLQENPSLGAKQRAPQRGKYEEMTEKNPFGISFVNEKVSRPNDSINIVDKSEINKKFIQKNGCDFRKIAYSGLVVRRNKWTKDFEPFIGSISNKDSKKFLSGASKSSIWGTLFLGPENPLTDRQCHFFGQKQLSTIDTNSLQRDYLRQLGKEILTQSNSKGYTELSKFSSIERTKILSLSKKVNSFFFKKRKYSYLLEPKDQWHLLFQEQLCTALEDCKKYPRSFEEEKLAERTLGSGRIKVSAPLVMARFPKKLAQSSLMHNKQKLSHEKYIPSKAKNFLAEEIYQIYKYPHTIARENEKFPLLTPSEYENHQLEQSISWRPLCHLQRSFIYAYLPLQDTQSKDGLLKDKWENKDKAKDFLSKAKLCKEKSVVSKIPFVIARKLVQQAHYPHYPLFTERFSEEINAIPYLNKNSLFYSTRFANIPSKYPSLDTKQSVPQRGKYTKQSVRISRRDMLAGGTKNGFAKRNNLVGIQNMGTSLLIQEPLNRNSWTVLNQWIFLIALLFWVEQTLVNNVFPALFALEQILLNAAGLRTGENNRTHALRISKNETPKFQNLAGIDGLLGELSELVLFLRGQRNLGVAKLSFWNKKNSYGVLLTGSPGTGKTFLVRALANEAKVPVLILSASTLTASKLNNNKPSWSIRHAFKRAKQLAPCILFIDEIDALGKSRGKIVTDINEIVADTNLISASFLTHKNTLTKSTTSSSSTPRGQKSSHSSSPIAQQMFSYEQFGQNYSNFNATLLNKWEYPLQSTILQESNEINQNSLCQEKLVDLLKITVATAQGFTPTGGTHGVQDYSRGAFTSIANPLGKESAAEFKKESMNETSRSDISDNSNKGVEKEMTRGKFGPLTQLLVSMDGVSSFSGVLIMGATNRPELLDPALTRPGRFEKIIRIDKPSEQNRIEILQLYSQNLGIQQQIPWSYLATRTIGLTTADLAVAMNYSALKAIIQDSVHTLETIEYGLNCITRL